MRTPGCRCVVLVAIASVFMWMVSVSPAAEAVSREAMTAQVAPLSGATDSTSFESEVKQAFGYGDFDRLEALCRRARGSAERDAQGRSTVTIFISAVKAAMVPPKEAQTEAYYDNLDAFSKGWLDAHPASALALSVRLWALNRRAWWYRGEGYANTLSPQQRTLFKRTTAAAVAETSSHTMDDDDVIAHDALLVTLLGADPDARVHWLAVEKTLALHPDALHLWRHLAMVSTPEWGGSWEQVDRLIRLAAARQADSEAGDMVYAQLWAAQAFDLQGGFFNAPVDWDRLKRGFDLFLANYPRSFLVNDEAKLACLKGDHAAAAASLARIGDAPRLDRWDKGTEARAVYDRCRRWVASPESLPAPQPAAQPSSTPRPLGRAS